MYYKYCDFRIQIQTDFFVLKYVVISMTSQQYSPFI